jgi:hypothetical protein
MLSMWMLKTRSKKTSTKRNGTGAARKGSPKSHEAELKVGDWVRIVNISGDLKNPKYDLKDPEMRTAELFRYCVGRKFLIRGFDRYKNIELEVSDDAAVRKRFGKFHTIWCEPEFVVRVTNDGQRSP